jgi:predicted transposase YbfD/YdcC
MDYTTLPIPPDAGLIPESVAVASLYEALHQLSDARRGQGKRYELALMLCLLVLAKLAGETSLSGATEWIRHRAAFLADQFKLQRKTMPCQMTYCNVLARVDAKHLDEILATFFVRWEAEQRCGAEPSRLHTPQGQADHAHLAIDGKTLRATSSQPHPVHQLSCYEVATGIVLWHCNVQEKENEISALKPLLTPHLIKGRIFTLDAMHTQRALCAQIQRFGGDYLLIAKDNQPTLHEDSADLFEDRTPDRRRWKQAETWDKGHGRLEHRQITCSPDLNDWFGKDWQGVEQVFRLERTARLLKTNQTRHEVVYGLSNLSMQLAPPQRLLSLVRDHWAIENKLHYRRDGSLGEDACQTRTGPVPSLLAQLNSAVLSFMDRAGVCNVARQMRYFDAHPEQALALVLTGSCSVY